MHGHTSMGTMKTLLGVMAWLAVIAWPSDARAERITVHPCEYPISMTGPSVCAISAVRAFTPIAVLCRKLRPPSATGPYDAG